MKKYITLAFFVACVFSCLSSSAQQVDSSRLDKSLHRIEKNEKKLNKAQHQLEKKQKKVERKSKKLRKEEKRKDRELKKLDKQEDTNSSNR